MKPDVKRYTAKVGDHEVIFETGKLAGQAGGSVTVQLGDSIIFAAATMGNTPREGQDFFPLTVEYEERMYAGGRIPGSFFRREGRPTQDAILTSRLIDRPLRPLFNQSMRNEVQVVCFSLSADMDNPLDILAINAASAAMMISDIPWAGPVGAVRVGRIDGEFVANPTFADLENSDLDLRLAGTREAILMVECAASEQSEEIMVEALMFGHKAIQPLVDLQEKMAKEIGKAKREVPLFELDKSYVDKMEARVKDDVIKAMDAPHTKAELKAALKEIETAAVEEFAGEDAALKSSFSAGFEEVYKQVVRS
ncbi:MAG: polyribonucleotide nucleotidyltransferase, partial [Anaerolineaceae bacterium]|nr:polyribonucleotide nucleotidyltransferase [Anaerolineaceae bacterium]